MYHLRQFFFITCASVCIIIQMDAQDVTQWVNPLIGTDKSDAETVWGVYGGAYPGAVAPWGAVQISPETQVAGERGYFYSDSVIRYFTCVNHKSGYPEGSHGNIQLQFAAGETSPSQQTFRHANEKAAPGYYAVKFDDGSSVETTATTHTGMFRYYPASAPYAITIADAGAIEVVDNKTVYADRQNVCFLFNHPYTRQQSGDRTVTLIFDQLPGEDGLLIKAGFSGVDRDGSLGNLSSENPGWDFDAIREQTRQEWNSELEAVQIEASSSDDRIKFYTALYHSFLIPGIISDADGRYRGSDRQIYRSEKVVYGGFSTWDTFRTLHPLLCLLKPDRQADMICSMLDIYDRTGFLPFMPMTGYHSIPVITDSYNKGVAGFDTQKAYEAMRKCLLGDRLPRQNTYTYIRDGFLNDSIEESVSVTLDYAYNDWALSVFADVSGYADDAQVLRERSFNYRHLFDTETQFMLPRNSGGFVRHPGEMGYKEANRWTASWFVPHNMQDIINLSGGDSCFVAHLRDAVEGGQIVFDNETVLHYPYLFAYAGRPDLTCRWVDRIRETCYAATPGGIPGNDDLGAMSSWYVFGALGIFPFCPGRPEYVLTSPLFASATLHPKNGKTIRITADAEAIHHPFTGLQLNGQPYRKLFITHDELTTGGTLHFQGNPTGADYSGFQRPSSLTTATPEFRIEQSDVVRRKVSPHEETYLRFTVSNHGATGVFPATLYEHDRLIATKKTLVKEGESLTDSIPFRLYAKGKHTLSFERRQWTVEVITSDSDERLTCAVNVRQPLVRAGEDIHIKLSVQNISGLPAKGTIPVYAGDSIVVQAAYDLNPGQQDVRTLSLHLPAGFHQLKAMGQAQTVKVYERPDESCVLSVDFERWSDSCAYDRSGFGNDGVVCGTVGRKQREQGWALSLENGGYVQFPLSESLDITGNTLTMAAWVYPTGKSSGYMDFFTKGDYHVFQIAGNELSFFAGGWGRGTCSAPLPDDWLNHWHHIAGVCDGKELRLYIDGDLKQSLPVEGLLAPTEILWNIGRNAEMPYSRQYKGQIDEIKIYKDALTDDDVRGLYRNKIVYH
ncbi:MAG: GH92 family glycosyl hydrolase [Tannerella sp.]|nr:GH92 family glycosyl hydrolase [Tannerella sp.]